jgi:hypothetical protein
MKTLFSYGFTSLDLSFLTGGRWKAESIRKYCRGLEVKDVLMKEKVMNKLLEFVEMDLEWNDVEKTVDFNEKLNREIPGLKLDDLLVGLKEIQKRDHKVTDILNLLSFMKQNNQSLDAMYSRLKNLDKLFNKGWTPTIFDNYIKAAKSFGDPEMITRALEMHETLTKMTGLLKLLDEERMTKNSLIEKQELVLKDLENKIEFNKNIYELTLMLVTIYGFDLPTFNSLVELAKKHGSSLEVIALLNTYNDKKQLEKELMRLKSEIEVFREETNILRQMNLNLYAVNADLNQKIGSISEKFKSSLLLQKIAKLLDNPIDLILEKDEFINLVYKLVVSIRDFGYINRSILGSWTLYVQSYIVNTANILSDMMVGKI